MRVDACVHGVGRLTATDDESSVCSWLPAPLSLYGVGWAVWAGGVGGVGWLAGAWDGLRRTGAGRAAEARGQRHGGGWLPGWWDEDRSRLFWTQTKLVDTRSLSPVVELWLGH